MVPNKDLFQISQKVLFFYVSVQGKMVHAN